MTRTKYSEIEIKNNHSFFTKINNLSIYEFKPIETLLKESNLSIPEMKIIDKLFKGVYEIFNNYLPRIDNNYIIKTKEFNIELNIKICSENKKLYIGLIKKIDKKIEKNDKFIEILIK